MNTSEKYSVVKTSNYPEQKLLSELELLDHLERHFTGNPACPNLCGAPLLYHPGIL